MWRTTLKCIGLGALAALGWLTSEGVEFYSVADSSSTRLEWEPWMRIAVRAALVLSVPALALLLSRSTSTWLWHHPGFVVAIALPALLVAALPALFLWSRPADGLALPLQVPTASLGLALGITDGVRRLRPGEGGYVPSALLASAGFGVALLLVAVAYFVTTYDAPCTGQCGGLKFVVLLGAGILALFSALTGLIGALLGYAAGAGLTHLATRTTAPGPN